MEITIPEQAAPAALSIPEIAVALGIDQSTVNRHLRKSGARPIQRIGGSDLYAEGVVEMVSQQLRRNRGGSR